MKLHPKIKTKMNKIKVKEKYSLKKTKVRNNNSKNSKNNKFRK
jgi:hypothetical protein